MVNRRISRTVLGPIWSQPVDNNTHGPMLTQMVNGPCVWSQATIPAMVH